MLVGEAERRIRARGLAYAELGAEHDNPRARALYQRLGYVGYADAPDEWDAEGPAGEVVRYRTMCTLMRKPLNAAQNAPTTAHGRGSESRKVRLFSCPVRTEPLMIAGLAGPVVVESSFLSDRYTITAGGFPAARVGRKRYALPTAGWGPVDATVTGGFFAAYPTLTINGVKHRTGPPVPVVLRFVAVVPFALVFLGGLVGGLFGGIGWAVNMAILRLGLPWAAKAVLMLAVLVATFLTWVAVASLIAGAISG